ncbi:MAG: inorganic pyrophosphatase [Anaerolineae bacterium]
MATTSFFSWRPHPWHGLEVGPSPPSLVHAYIEITPYDLIKYEVDKVTGYLRVDRPQQTSSQPPTLYGIIPRTYCGPRVAALCKKAAEGDGDPLDICVVSERPIERAEIVLNARVVGGISTIDGGKADDKIVAVLHNDNFWGGVADISELPARLIERLEHYFSTYKLMPGRTSRVSVETVYHAYVAQQIVSAAIEDYQEVFGGGK